MDIERGGMQGGRGAGAGYTMHPITITSVSEIRKSTSIHWAEQIKKSNRDDHATSLSLIPFICVTGLVPNILPQRISYPKTSYVQGNSLI